MSVPDPGRGHPSGEWLVTLLRVGTLDLPGESLAPAGQLDSSMRIPVNIVVARRGDAVVMIDAGAGPLEALFAAARSDPLPGLLQPTLVILTHLDTDHAGGVMRGTWPDIEPRYRCPVTVCEQDLDYWLQAAPVPEGPSGGEVARRLADAGLLRALPDGAEPIAGLRLRSAPGHRAGHCVLEVGPDFVFAADLVHHRSHFAHPEWDAAYDQEPLVALATRRRLLTEFARRGCAVAFSHLDGIGRVSGVDRVFTWNGLDTSRSDAAG